MAALDQGIPFWQTPTSMQKWMLLFFPPVIFWVAQGSILGPLLFLLYVNDLPQQVLHSDIFLFADDTKCLKSVSSVLDSSLLQQDLNHLSTWSTNWKLSFKESKCLLLTFQSKPPTHSTLPYSISGHAIRNCHQHKDLGILMSSDLSWSSHISSITNQAHKKLRLLCRSLCSGGSVLKKEMLYVGRAFLF